MNCDSEPHLPGGPTDPGHSSFPPGTPAFGELWTAAEVEYRCGRYRRYLLSAVSVLGAAIAATYLVVRTTVPFEDSMESILVALDHGGTSPLGRWEAESDRWFAPDPEFSLFE